MSHTPPNPSHLRARYGMIFVAMAALVSAFLYAAGLFGGHGTTAQQFVNLQQGTKPQFSFRRAHAKGMCVQGDFVASGLLSPYTTAEFFQQGEQPFIGRFSTAGANPLAPDLAAPVRSLALSFSSESGQRWRTAMNTPPVLAVGNPEDFFQQLQALQPDPATGKPNFDKLKAFFSEHPESAQFNQWKQSYVPTTSFSTEQYHSTNAFYLINQQGQRQAVRWAAVPQADAQAMPGDISNSDPDALQLDLAERLQTEPVRFDLMVTLADASDDETNPTVAWPTERTTINAGTVVIRSVQAQKGGACEGINFDPLVLPEGMQATADPILNARGSAYAESYRRRAREIFIESQTAGAQQ